MVYQSWEPAGTATQPPPLLSRLSTHDVFESGGDIMAGLAALDDDGRFRVLVDLWLPLALRPQRLGVALLWGDVPGRHGGDAGTAYGWRYPRVV